MKSLKVGETVKLHHGGSLTQIKDFWSIDNIIKFRDTECKYAAFCREYAFSKWWDGFMCGFCSKVSKAVKAQMADFDFHRVKAPDNKYIPMGYKKIHKLANKEIMGSVKKKPAVKKFGLPDGA
ncbi:hypothetical protein KAU19_02520, partial [Candidatus Parcubacteria bacterium]|nr:hypothetical protein [Candidatus Parcubacteria bacterium]